MLENYERLDMTQKDWKLCTDCGDELHVSRHQAFCKFCERDRDASAKTARMSWCVVQEYGKGPYGYVTAEAAKKVLLDTNQKNIRS